MTNRVDWDDARLDAAFQARAARVAGPAADLAEDAIRRLDRGRPTRITSRRGWLAAAAGIVVLVGLAGVVAFRPAPPPPPAAASATPGATGPATAAASAALEAVLGEPISVSAAIAVRDGTEANGRELVVEGFLSPMPVIPCPFTPATENPTLLHCP